MDVLAPERARAATGRAGARGERVGVHEGAAPRPVRSAYIAVSSTGKERMGRRSLAAIGSGFVLASAGLSAHAQIYKCPDGHGAYSLQQAPCPGLGMSGGRLLVLPNGRLAPVAVAIPASGGASGVPSAGRVLGRTPLPSAQVARKPD